MSLSGPMFEPAHSPGMRSVSDKEGAHYNVFYADVGANGRTGDVEAGMRSLRTIFPTGKCDEYNLVLFSTSGVHGSYTSIEDIEASLRKYGDDYEPDGEEYPDDFVPPHLTFLIIHPRIVCLRCGSALVRLADVEWLKGLRRSGRDEFSRIGFGLDA